jgi:hypothetical protein
MKLWDPGISQAETIFFYPGSFLAGGDRLVLDRIPLADRNSSPGKEGRERVVMVSIRGGEMLSEPEMTSTFERTRMSPRGG